MDILTQNRARISLFYGISLFSCVFSVKISLLFWSIHILFACFWVFSIFFILILRCVFHIFCIFCFFAPKMPEICIFVSCWKSTSVKKGLKFHEKKIVKVLVVQEKALPLHSLSGSNAVASRMARWSLTTFHTDKQYNVSLVSYWNQRLKSKVRNENTNRQIIWHTYISGQYKQNSISYTFMVLQI